MTHVEFYYLVRQLRDTQRRYFKERRPEVLRACKALERAVDAAILEIGDMVTGREPIIGG